MLNKIKEIKKEMGDDLLILAHHYQNDQIVSVADYVGDSLKLAQMAEKNKTAKYIVFCGVHFMAETADILTEYWQKVLLPALTAGCPMANMADLDQAEKAWELLNLATRKLFLLHTSTQRLKSRLSVVDMVVQLLLLVMPAKFFLGHYLRKREFFSYLTRTLVKIQLLI